MARKLLGMVLAGLLVNPAVLAATDECEAEAQALTQAQRSDAVDRRLRMLRSADPRERVQDARAAATSALRTVNQAAALPNRFPDRCTTVDHLRTAYTVINNHYDVLRAALDEARLSNATVGQLGLIGNQLDLATPQLAAAATALAAMSAQYGLYVGPSFSLDGDGSWQEGVELLARFEPEAGTPADSRTCFKPFVWCRAYAEFSYQVIGAVDAATDAAPEAGVTAPNNPFLRSGGYFRFNGGVRAHISEWLGLRAGVGLSSLPEASAQVVRLEPRYFAGLDFQTIYDDGAMGQLFLGFAHDEFWEREEFRDPNDPAAGTVTLEDHERWVLDGVFMVPRIEAVGFRIAGRLYADAPVTGAGPSEVRASILFYQDFSKWLSLFDPLKDARRPPAGY